MKLRHYHVILICFVVWAISGCSKMSEQKKLQQVNSSFCEWNSALIVGCINGYRNVELPVNQERLTDEEKKKEMAGVRDELYKWSDKELMPCLKRLGMLGEHEVVDLSTITGGFERSGASTSSVLFAWKYRDVIVLTSIPVKKVTIFPESGKKFPTVTFRYDMNEMAQKIAGNDLFEVPVSQNFNLHEARISHPSDLIYEKAIDTLVIRISPEQLKSESFIKTAFP